MSAYSGQPKYCVCIFKVAKVLCLHIQGSQSIVSAYSGLQFLYSNNTKSQKFIQCTQYFNIVMLEMASIATVLRLHFQFCSSLWQNIETQHWLFRVPSSLMFWRVKWQAARSCCVIGAHATTCATYSNPCS